MDIRGIRTEGLRGLTIPYEKDQKGILKMGDDLEITTQNETTIVSTEHFVLDVNDVQFRREKPYFPELLCIDSNGKLFRAPLWWFVGMIGVVGWLWK